MRSQILASVEDSIAALEQLKRPESLLFIEQASAMLIDCYKRGSKVLIAGNGGSLCDAVHFAEELTGFFRGKRKALPAIALAEPGHITCVGNDIGFDAIFSRGIEAYGKPGDVFIGLSTSGNSSNIVQAVEAAKHAGLKVITLLGKGGGQLKDEADLQLVVDRFKTSDRIQEVHMAILHILVEMIEVGLFQPLTPEMAIPVS